MAPQHSAAEGETEAPQKQQLCHRAHEILPRGSLGFLGSRADGPAKNIPEGFIYSMRHFLPRNSEQGLAGPDCRLPRAPCGAQLRGHLHKLVQQKVESPSFPHLPFLLQPLFHPLSSPTQLNSVKLHDLTQSKGPALAECLDLQSQRKAALGPCVVLGLCTGCGHRAWLLFIDNPAG